MIAQYLSSINNLSFDDLDIATQRQANQLLDETLLQAKASTKPQYHHVAGIPGAGKSYYIDNSLLAKLECIKPVVIQFDNIMTELKEYKKDLAQEINPLQCFKKWEMPARIIGYELLNRAVEKGYSIIFENSGVDSRHLALMQQIESIGYSTHYHFINCSIELAQQRVLKRKQSEIRQIPTDLITERYHKLQPLIAEYQALANYTVELVENGA